MVITPGEPTPGGAEEYYKRIHAHRTVLAIQAQPKLVEAPPSSAAAALLRRVFASERETEMVRERLQEVFHERDQARGEVILLTKQVQALKEEIGKLKDR